MVIIHVSKFAMLVLVETVLDLGKGSVRVRSQVRLKKFTNFVILSFWAAPGNALGLLLVLPSGITPGRLMGPNGC